MIYLFRKEIKKWNNLWWVVIASLALGSISFIFFRPKSKSTIKVVSVNGNPIYLKEFQHVFAEIKASIDDMAMYWGISPEQLASMMGMKDIAATSIDRCVENFLFDNVTNDFSVNMDSKSFQDSLAKSVTRNFIDQQGKLNIKAYQNYLAQMHMTISDFESRKEKEFKRNLISRFIEQSGYTPKYITEEIEAKQNVKKSFSILKLPISSFVLKVEAEGVKAEELEKFFKNNKENYKVSEKKKVKYWALTPDEYKEKVSVDEELIERFYEKNKSALYRIPPKVKIKTIIVEDLKKAEEIQKKIVQNPEKFSEIAKASPGTKLESIDYFNRGTHDPEMERVAFLKLKNKGDISEVVKTGRGFEIIKLEDRISASEKPLSKVRGDVVKTLKERKSLFALRGDMEAVIRTSKTDPEIFEKFSEENNLKGKESDWLSSDDAKGYELVNVIARKILEGDKGIRRKGYFVHQGKHVLYKVTDKKASSVPEFKDVQDDVKKDLYNQKAEKLQKDTIKRLRKELLLQKTPIEKVAETNDLKIVTTKLLKQGEEFEPLKDAGNILNEAFLLNDQSQVFEYKHESSYFLVKLIDSKIDEKMKKIDEQDVVVETEKRRMKKRYLDAFIASLFRIARIDVNEEILKSTGYKR